MSTATTSSTALRPRTSPQKKVTQARVVLSEWTKLRSLRSTIFSMLAAVVFIVGLVHPGAVRDRRALAAARPR